MNVSNTGEETQPDGFGWNNGRLTYHESASTLFKMSFFKVALQIWNRCVSQSSSSRLKDDYNCFGYDVIYTGPKKNLLYESMKSLLHLKSAESIENEIGRYLVRIRLKIQTWANYLDGDVFAGDLYNHRIERVSPTWLRWRSNGDIDFEKTVSNMLSAVELNRVQKFVVMCKFCLVDEISTVSLNSLPSSFVESMSRGGDTMVQYWIYYLRNETDKIFLGYSIDMMMAKRSRNVFAFEYFWNRLNADDRISVATFNLDRTGPYGYVFLRKIVTKMTPEQQNRLFCREPAQIVKILWICLGKPEYAVSI